jgi:ferredoxin
MPKIKFVNEKQEIEVPAGANLREEALKNGIQVYNGVERFAHCMGHGMCGACKVIVKTGQENLSPKSMLEKAALLRMLSSVGNKDLRLSCQTTVNGDCEIVTQPKFNWFGENFWQKPYPNK